MQADNLRPEDMEKFEKLFKEEIKPKNSEATLHTFLREKFTKKNCIFKDKCK